MIASVDFLGFRCAQHVFASHLIERTKEIRVAVARLCVSANVEAKDCCHEDLEMFSDDAFSIIWILVLFLGFFLTAATWLKMVPDGLDGVVLRGVTLSHEAHEEHDLSHRDLADFGLIVDFELLVDILKVCRQPTQKEVFSLLR